LPLHTPQFPALQSVDGVPAARFWHVFATPLHCWQTPHGHVVPNVWNLSVGQLDELPVHVSVISQESVGDACLHTVPAGAGLWVHVCVPKLQVGASHRPVLVLVQSESDMHCTQFPL